MRGELTRAVIPYPRRVRALAKKHPARVAIVYLAESGAETTISWRHLDEESDRVALSMARRGLVSGGWVAVGLRNSPEHFFATIGAWKVGAGVLPFSTRMPPWERDRLLNLLRPHLVVTRGEPEPMGRWTVLDPSALDASTQPERQVSLPEDPLPETGKAMPSGGSTGRPKLIIDPSPLARIPGESMGALGAAVGFCPGQTQLVAGPLFHNAPFMWAYMGLFEDQTLVVLERFDEHRAVAAIAAHQVAFAFMVPTMMRRILDNVQPRASHLSSIRTLLHAAAACPPRVKRAWIDLLGDRLVEIYGATEAIGYTMIRGIEWLEHLGSVGKPVATDIVILEDGSEALPPHVVGDVYMRPSPYRGATYRYAGSPRAPHTPSGYTSVGDLGYLDESGYLFLCDRRNDVIVSGGTNVYPAEVEAALESHPAVEDVAVVGIPDEDLGQRIRAVVQLREGTAAPPPEELIRYARQLVSRSKVPHVVEFVPVLPRDEAGKLRRSAI